MIVGVYFSSRRLRDRWIEYLRPLLPDCQVGDADDVDPEVLVVGNPAGSELRRFARLRFVQSTWAGVERLAVDAPRVPIARMVAPGLTEAMIEFVEMSVLMLHRDVPRYLRQQQAAEWEPKPQDRSRPSVGVAGFGELGRPVAEAIARRGFRVTAWARHPRSGEIEVVAGRSGWAEMLARSDIVVNLLPLTAATRGIFDAAAFEHMKPGTGFINVARGGHVVEDALLAALDAGTVGEAILDVFASEPLPTESSLWRHPRVMVFPHVAAFSRPETLAPHVAANIRRFAGGEPPRFLVD